MKLRCFVLRVENPPLIDFSFFFYFQIREKDLDGSEFRNSRPISDYSGSECEHHIPVKKRESKQARMIQVKKKKRKISFLTARHFAPCETCVIATLKVNSKNKLSFGLHGTIRSKQITCCSLGKFICSANVYLVLIRKVNPKKLKKKIKLKITHT